MKNTLLAIIQLYVVGIISLEKLEDWYAPKLESLIDDSGTIHIVAQLELELAELNDGLLTENDLKNNLKSMLRDFYGK